MRRVSGGVAARYCCYAVCVVAIFEFVALNIFMLYAVSYFRHTISDLTSQEDSSSYLNRLQENGILNSVLNSAKSNRLFQRTLQETLERVHVMHSEQVRTKSGTHVLKDARDRTMKDISFISLDVSHSREATYIYNRILSRTDFPYHFFIVDIGANDGFLSSNSFNFIQWGWDAVLVDPQGSELQSAWHNIKSYIDQYNEGNQRVELVRAAITDKDGSVDFHYSSRGQGTMSHVASFGVNKKLDDEVTLHVQAMTVKTLAAKNRIPKNFGILSIDAEGVGLQIIKQWLALGFRPAYIIFEYLNLGEPEGVFLSRLSNSGYTFLGKRGWNFIFEHQSLPRENSES